MLTTFAISSSYPNNPLLLTTNIASPFLNPYSNEKPYGYTSGKCTLSQSFGQPSEEPDRPRKKRRSGYITDRTGFYEDGKQESSISPDQIPRVYITEYPFVANPNDTSSKWKEYPLYVDDRCQPVTHKTRPALQLDNIATFEDLDSSYLLPPVSPLETPSSYHDNVLQHEDTEMKHYLETDYSLELYPPGFDNSPIWSPLDRFLSDDEEPATTRQQQQDELPLSGLIESDSFETTGSDVRNQVVEFENDLNFAMDAMVIDDDANICNISSEKCRSQTLVDDLEANKKDEQISSLVPEDEELGRRCVSSELESWMKSSSLIGLRLNPVGGVKSETSRLCHGFPENRKRKAPV